MIFFASSPGALHARPSWIRDAAAVASVRISPFQFRERSQRNLRAEQVQVLAAGSHDDGIFDRIDRIKTGNTFGWREMDSAISKPASPEAAAMIFRSDGYFKNAFRKLDINSKIPRFERLGTEPGIGKKASIS